jgi:hypothetical protein
VGLLSALLCVGCLGTISEDRAGAAVVSASGSALVQTGVQSLALTIGPGVGAPFAPIVALASPSGEGAWTVFVTGIPAGAGRTFHLEACDIDGPCDATVARAHHLFAGDAMATVSAGATAQVYVLLEQLGAPESFVNLAPVLDSLTASAAVVAPGAQVALGVRAHDPDPAGGAPGTLWRASCGALAGAATTADVRWTAPTESRAQTCALEVTVSECCGSASTGTSVTASLGIRVVPADAGEGEDGDERDGGEADDDTCPAILGVHHEEHEFQDEQDHSLRYESRLQVAASDADGDALRYVWSSPDCPGGIFLPGGGNPSPEIADTGPGSRTVQFRSPGLVACEVQVEVR